VVGVGDPKSGSFIDGRQSRQDVSTLRQIAVRLNGDYHNGNEKQLPTEMVELLVPRGHEGPFERLTKREYALLASAVGAILYALLPLLLHYGGSRWSPGVPVKAGGIVKTTARGRKRLRSAEAVSSYT
jgi:Ca-activated chloride channel family protein